MAKLIFSKQGIADRVTVINLPMEKYFPSSSHDCFWFQWCIGHLVDFELIELLTRLKDCLSPDGFIVIKDNFASTEKTEFDSTDSSVARPLERVKNIIKSAGFIIIEEEKQKDFPLGLYPVYSLALRPNNASNTGME